MQQDLTLSGIHHLTAITANAVRNHAFYTQVLGLRLVKKTVNQDDTSAYHLFYADGLGSPGTDITFFDWPVARQQRGAHEVTRTGFRIRGEAAFAWWSDHFKANGIAAAGVMERDGRLTLDFEDFEGQRLSLVDDDGTGEAHLWAQSPIAAEHQIRGLGPITMSVPDLAPTHRVLTQVMGMAKVHEFGATSVYRMNGSGPVAELQVTVDPTLPPAQQGAGSVHHVAFNIPHADYDAWTRRLKEMRIPNSGPVDRFWFKSLYFREPNGVLFELATDAPGFAADESLETLGQTLSLPPFLEGRRAEIESKLKKL
jgi:glyoxalase family protein